MHPLLPVVAAVATSLAQQWPGTPTSDRSVRQRISYDLRKQDARKRVMGSFLQVLLVYAHIQQHAIPK